MLLDMYKRLYNNKVIPDSPSINLNMANHKVNTVDTHHSIHHVRTIL